MSNYRVVSQYGSIFRKLNDPEELNGLASSLTSVSSSLGLDVAALSAGSAQDAFLTKRYSALSLSFAPLCLFVCERVLVRDP